MELLIVMANKNERFLFGKQAYLFIQLRFQNLCSDDFRHLQAPFLWTSEVGSKETDEKADEVLKLEILDCWTPQNHYRWSKSKCSQTLVSILLVTLVA